MTKNKKPSTNIWEFAGWAGVLFIAASYGLLALGMLDGAAPTYHLLVLTGSVFVAVISYRKKAYQPFTLNVIFAILAMLAVMRIILS